MKVFIFKGEKAQTYRTLSEKVIVQLLRLLGPSREYTAVQ